MAASSAETDSFPKEVATVSKIPADWMASWCQQQAGAALGDAIVVKMLKAEPQTVDRLAAFALQLPRNLALPAEARAKKVCARLLDERSKTMGCRLNRAWVKNVKGDGKIDWATGGDLPECRGSGSVIVSTSWVAMGVYILGWFVCWGEPSP